jgi:hypothetical protein
MANSASPCIGQPEPSLHAGWGIVHVTVKTTVQAMRGRLVGLLLDYAQWPRIFSATIARTELVRRDARSMVVMVHHRREGRVVNVLTDCGDGVVVLREFKPRYVATFVNHFDPVPDGTRYTVDAALRIKQPFTLIAPLLRGVVERAIRRYTIEPLRSAADGRISRTSHSGVASDS